jgi:hypothetical protein
MGKLTRVYPMMSEVASLKKTLSHQWFSLVECLIGT